VRTALVTLTLGRRYAETWRALCEPGWRRYCERHGYDLVVLDAPLDDSPRARGRSPAWQKCLALSQPFADAYDRVVWVDADVLVNPDAPPVADGIPAELVGAVDEYASPTPELHRQTLAKLYRRWEAEGVPFVRNETARDYYRVYGLPGSFDSVVQTGVMVLSPRHHRPLLEHVYDAYEDRGAGWNYEMRPLSYELLRAACVAWLDPRFNTIWGSHKALRYPHLVTHPDHPSARECAARALREVHFLHFAGAPDELVAAAPEPAPEPRPRRAGRVTTAALQTPVVLLLHARPDTTARLARIVRDARPPLVLAVADGPRAGQEARCDEVRAIVDGAGWDCELRTSYAATNLGLKRRIETGLGWAFSQVEEAIVLEDDCLPHPSFFAYCDELLARYRGDERVLTISGNCFEPEPAADDGARSYRFSRYPLIWGWATWRRAWRHYDPALARWPDQRASGWLDRLLDDPQAVQYWTYLFERTRARQDTWDYAWLHASWAAGGLSVVPARNLVTNVGFRDDATNTRAEHRGVFADVPAVGIDLPLRHPERVERDDAADAFLEDVMFSGNVGRMFERIRSRRPRAGAAT
jgi:hypothetical protein